MMELLNVYRCQFKKREPIVMAANSFAECIDLLYKDSELKPKEGDELVKIELNFTPIFV